MKSSTASLLTSAALLTTAAADAASTWLQWSSSTPAPVVVPVTVTDYETTVETVYKTVDNYITVTETPTPVTVYITETETETETSVSVSVSGSVATIDNTIVNTVTNVAAPITVYVTSVAVSVSVAQSLVTVTDTITDTETLTDTVTSLGLTTVTESALSGLVTCPSRIINPTYTPPGPLPSGYLWGCPVGTLCKPPRIGCNFEQNPPADTYFCSPDQCEPIVPLPPYDSFYLDIPINGTCAWLTPIDDYFNLNPTYFGLNYGIFDIYGQSTCAFIPTSTVYITVSTTVIEGTTVVVTAPTTLVEYSNVPTTVVNTVVDTQYSNVPVPTTLVQYSNVPVPTTAVQYSNVPVPTTVTVYQTVSGSSTWGVWNTKRDDVEERGLEKRIGLVAQTCYPHFLYANLAYQATHTVPALCESTNSFISALNGLKSCSAANPVANGDPTFAASVLVIPAAYCGQRFKREVAPEPAAPAPAFRFARG